jgi:DNA polymerase-4
VIVGGLAGRGVVCAASYEARPFGVHSAMPIVTARRLCPHAVFLPPRMAHYVQVSRQIREILFSFTPLVEPLSLDEAFLDVRGCEALFGPAAEVARQVKARIHSDTGLVASVGVAPNKFLAKLASDHGKPDGYVVVSPEAIGDFLAPLSVGRIWGVGAKGEKRLHALGIRTIGQLAAISEGLLANHFGDSGRHMWRLAHGEDDRTVVPDREAKSISAETTFAQDIGDVEVLRVWLLDLVEQLGRRLRHVGLMATRIELKVRSSDFHTITRSTSLPDASDATEVVWEAARGLMERSLSAEILPIRLLGVGGSRLVRAGSVQGSLFDGEDRERRAALDQTMDAIRDQFGEGAIQRGSILRRAKSPGSSE